MKKKNNFNINSLVNVRRERQIEGQVTLSDWMEWKEDIKCRIEDTKEHYIGITENFVVIGYRLKQFRDTEKYREAGYASISEFARQEFDLSKDIVSRLMKINDRYSVDGNSMELREEFREYGFTQLREMITFSPEEMEMADPKMTVRQIEDIKKYREADAETEDPLGDAIMEFFAGHMDQMEAVAAAVEAGETNRAYLIINPMGYMPVPTQAGYLIFNGRKEGVTFRPKGGSMAKMDWETFLTEVREKYRNLPPMNPPEPEECPEAAGQEEESCPEAAGYEAPENRAHVVESTVAARQREDDDWKEPKKKPENKPAQLPPVDATYREKMGKTMLEEITDGNRRYVILKMHHKYRVGNTIILQEHDGGKPTGNVVTFTVSHMTDDSGGLNPGYCVLGFLNFETGTEEMEDEE